MSFQTPITIAQAMDKIYSNEYLLPAIQREFVWPANKIEWLFDSLMKGYPISSFLFWKVNEKTAQNYTFYKFIDKYRQWYKTHNEPISTDGIPSFTAILDGQQRLTALYIGLRGSYAYKEYRKRWEDNEYSIPTRHLYLNITRPLENEEDDKEYEFSFLKKENTKEDDIYIDSNDQMWFKVGSILNYRNEESFDELIDNFELAFSRKSLRQLRRVVFEKPIINYFLEEEQDLNKALNIFIRVNSGGQPLSFSDLVMSVAIANWSDAREEINQLVDEVVRKGFYISKDLVLKSFLYLHSADIKYKVTNFSSENAEELKEKWSKIRATILETFELLKTFGFNDYNLTSKNAVIPVIYYLYHKDVYEGYSSSIKFKEEREFIRKWFHTILLKQVFASSSDTVLIQFRQEFTDDVINKPLKDAISYFPREFKKIRSFSANDDFIDDLLSTQMGSKYAFSILSLLYPNLDYRNNFHQDHLHPKADFNNLNDEDKNKYKWESYNSICNLQLLEGNENSSKNASSLADWIEKSTQNKDRDAFLERHLIPNLEDYSIENFGEFYERRKELLAKKLKELLQ
ncbi:hypothetical protein A4G20_08420 [Pasteurellaceae bacterium RH1A]|nr:hypothetical protein A4G20_08420 [Pasteurellaceae bacterium RH1A]